MTREEAIEVIKAKADYLESDKRFRAAVETIIPELAESEDERIRRKMVEHFKSKTKETWCNMPVKDIISYLEKQKDLDKMIVVSPEVWDNAITDAYENGKRDSEKQKEQKPLKVGENAYFDPNTEMWFIKKEQKPAEWSEEDERNIRNLESVLYYDKYLSDETRTELGNFLKSLPERFNLQPKQEWSEEDERMIGRIRSVVNECASYNDALDVNGDYCEGDYAKLDAWLKSLPERKNLPPKQEWDKEDEIILKWIEDILLIADGDLSDKLNGRVSPITDSAYSSMKLCIAKCLSWLKSLPLNLKKKNEDVAKLCSNEWSEEDEKIINWAIETLEHEHYFTLSEKLKPLRPHWKPSEEQMKAMSYFVRKHQATANRATTKWPEFEAFKSLYNDLKKRM